MFNLGASELLLILVIALVVFGPGKLPEVGKAIGKSLHEFKRAMNGEETNSIEEKREKKEKENNGGTSS